MKKIQNIHWSKDFLRAILPVMLVTVLASCSKMDDYKKFAEGGEISYTGKLDTVDVFSGKSRVFIKGLLNSDPKVKKAIVYWNNMADSIIVPVNRTANNDTLKFFVNNIQEGIQNFVIYTYDDFGNRSIPVYKTGRVYGDRYQATLTNRGLSVIMDGSGLTTVSWSGMDRLSGVFATELIYINNSGLETTIRASIDDAASVLTNYKVNTPIKYRTLFLPDTMSVDTFYTSYQQVRSIFRDVTSDFLLNTKAPFSQSEFNGRWGTPSSWITNSAVKNWSASGKFFGGVDRNQSHRLSMEAGWTNGNLLSFTNGKIYQSPVLPAGAYTFEVDVVGASSAAPLYIVASEGTIIPNIENLNTSLGNTRITGNGTATYSVNFDVAQDKAVSIGMVGTLVGTASNGQFLKISAVRLKYVQVL